MQYYQSINEGIYDKGIFKAVFIIGAPGSGKDWILQQTIAGHGLKEINSDHAFEFLAKKANYDLKNMYQKPDDPERDRIRGRGKVVTTKMRNFAYHGRLGLVINGTGGNYDSIAYTKKALEGIGYDTMMVYVNTSDNISRKRNILRGLRGGRRVPEEIRKQKWNDVHENVGKYQALFKAKNFFVIDNNKDMTKVSEDERKEIRQEFLRVFRAIGKFVNSPVKNGLAKKWVRDEKVRRGITEEENPKYYKKIKKLGKTKSQDRITYNKLDNADAISSVAGTGQFFGTFSKVAEEVINQVLPIKRK